jgi:Flp pilus assembly protein TadB
MWGVLIPVAAIVAVFVFVAVVSWSDNRRKEREAFYRHETYRKMLEHAGEGPGAVEQLMEKEEALRQRRRVDGMRLGGLITLATGIGIALFLYVLDRDDSPVWVAGVIPILIGLVLVYYGYFAMNANSSSRS